MKQFEHTIALDAMGGENAPDKVIEGLKLFLDQDRNIFFLLHGKEEAIQKSISKFHIPKENYKIIHCAEEIKDKDSVRDAIRTGKETSMWKAIDSVKNLESDLIISSGNTGALLVISKLIIKMMDGIDKPAIAGLWPNLKKTSVVLDLGANIEFNEKNYLDFSKIAAELYRVIFDEANPSVGLLNVGSEEIKGHETLKNAFAQLPEAKNNFIFKGYVEGNQIKDGNVDVIVTDGFSGNIALKTAEGTANGKICYLFSFPIFKKIKNTLDPRKYNGGIFLGLNAPVIKSHGGADALAFYYSIKLSAKILRGKLISRIQENFRDQNG